MDAIDKIEICKVVAQAILADGQITDAEEEFLTKLMDRYGLSDADRKLVLSRDIGEDPGESVSLIVDEDAKNELLIELALAVAVDGEIASSEMALLNRVAQALNIKAADLELMLKAAIA